MLDVGVYILARVIVYERTGSARYDHCRRNFFEFVLDLLLNFYK